MVMEYAVVEFLDPEDITMITVDIVHKTWLKSTQDAMFTYWPKLGASKKAKFGTIPDPQTWALYKIEILSTTEDYETAARRCKLAEDTSHIETEEEKEEEKEKTPKRKISQPSRYDDCDYEEEEQGCSTIKKKVKSLKSRSDMHRVTSNTTDESSLPSLPCPPITTSTPRGRKDPICYDGRSLSPEPIECSASTSLLDSRPHSCCDELVITEPPIPPIVRMSRQERKDNDNIMEKLDVMHKDQQEILSLLRKLNVSNTSSGGAENQAEKQSAVVDLKQIDSELEMEAFCSKLQDDQSFRRKMVKQLSALGGFSSGDTIRRMLRTLGTNGLWSKYSLKGKKGKIAVQPLPVCVE
ncbi:uncharacterized protein LOC127729725 isoform X2 [Mytilus californianus]|uniref:uncharacterized protein LOC127729725 isoform X2 n=1 Tax=Mytilus californianus TaxID=6549 RepID=UPI002246E550|nr:uncharacterized protein LOC127729725 isoform X2 [Mytilus californianus]